MVQLELSLREGAFHEAALAIAKLARLVVTPEEERSEVKSCKAVALPARKVCNMEWLLVFIKSVVHLGEIFYQGEVLQV